MYNLIKHLSVHNDVYLLSFMESHRERMYLPSMDKLCRKVYLVLREEQSRNAKEDLPRSVSRFYTTEMVEKLKRVIEEINPDVIDINFLIMTRYAEHIRGVPVVYTEHDISTINFETSFHDRDLPEYQRYIQWLKLLDFERKMLPKFDGVVAVSASDQKILRGFNDQIETALIPTGVDLDYFQPSIEDYGGENNTMVYIGNYRHYPNYAAMRYFVNKIFPAILSRNPQAKIYIVGPGLNADFAGPVREGVIITGEVADVRNYLKTAAVFVAPIRLGGGIKGKILEAMASGVPVVATEEASRGIACQPGEDIEVAINSDDFADKTTKLLSNRDVRARLGRRARLLMEKQYGWDNIAGQLDAYYDVLCNRYAAVREQGNGKE